RVEAGAPGVVPKATPIFLLFEADDLGYLGALGGGGLEGAQDRCSGRPRTNDGNALLHLQTPSINYAAATVRGRSRWTRYSCRSGGAVGSVLAPGALQHRGEIDRNVEHDVVAACQFVPLPLPPLCHRLELSERTVPPARRDHPDVVQPIADAGQSGRC